ncbi:hypothetical protein [Clostridium paridis]|uniref:Membrane-associated protein n=1 Tax=Clostridium paridis TaxID=2803863 RepID=A0A937K430_9CLOT|nr:hypothetical protein [Clostridium paridis]MBL4931439.1 hypothetical protein [Clostridium paridis]
MNKKQLAITVMLLFLMGLLFVGQGIFDEKFKMIALMNNNISTFKEYSSKDEEVKFLLPQEWSTTTQSFPGNYILYNNNFSDSKLGIYGYIQLINYTEDEEKLIEFDKKYIKDEIKDYEKEQLKDKKYHGSKVSFQTIDNKSNKYINRIYYIRLDEEKIAKIAFKVNSNDYKESYENIFTSIVDSVK